MWFARDPVARAVVTRDLTILALNQKAIKLLESHPALVVRDGLLAAKERRLQAELATLVSEAGVQPRLSVLGAGEQTSVIVESTALEAGARSPVGLILKDASARLEIECADLEAVFGVTPGEQLVNIQLLKGLSSREIAAASGKSVLTVRTHVKRAYGKIGVKTRGQLFARLLPYLSIR
jgi:DNA-binding CsgD family transcriptional regulator